MSKTNVLSIRIDHETRELLEAHAEALNMKVSLLASFVLRDLTENWVKNYAEQIARQYGLIASSSYAKEEF